MARLPGMGKDGAKSTAHFYFPSFLRQRQSAEIYDSWLRGEQGDADAPGERLHRLYTPEGVDAEYEELVRKSPNPWGGLVVKAVVQTMELTGMRMPGSEQNLKGWRTWQRNRMDARQYALYTGACGHGVAHVWGSQGVDPLTGEPMTKFKLCSAKDMASFFDDDDDEWPMMAIYATPYYNSTLKSYDGWNVRLIDETTVYYLTCTGDGLDLKDWEYVTQETHGAAVVPVVRYAPSLDIDGRANSDLQGLIPLLSRIDQDTFDRLIVQRFGAWKIRWIAGMKRPDNGTTEEQEAKKIKLRMESLLISESEKTKFGTLDATDLDGFIKARDSDLRDLSALSQTPPHHMLGLSSNLQAESLAAAETGLQRKGRGHRTSIGESHEQTFRLDAHFRKDRVEQQAYEMHALWRDNESRSLEQAAMALGMMATTLKVPLEMLWERIPGWTDNDSERAKKLVGNGVIDKLLAELEAEANAQQPTKPTGTGGSGGAA